MKGVRGSRKASKLARKDVISTMPEEVITNILHCLPLQDALKTSILSKDWKFKWTLMTQLVFDENFYEYLEKTEGFYDYLGKRGHKNPYGKTISKLLFHLKGAITKFVLYLPDDAIVDEDVINSWIIYLSKKGIKEFTFICFNGGMPELTTHLFSCLELTHLKLDNCLLHPSSEFGGFPNLLSLDVSNVDFRSSKCKEFLTRSPLLEIFKLSLYDPDKVKQIEIVKLVNLKILSLSLCDIEDTTVITSSSIFQLAGSLPKLQELSLEFLDCKISADAENRVPTSLPRLKTLDLYNIDFRNSAVISCAIELICGFPNLDSLSIKSIHDYPVQVPAVCSSQVDFSRMGQLQLRKVKLADIRGLKREVRLIKYLLDCSPLLKKMDIHADSRGVRQLGGDNGERKFATELLKLRRASPLAIVNIFWR